MASENSNFDLQSILADAQDLVDESFVARALLQPDTHPWESFPPELLYPTYDCLSEVHHSFLIGSAADSLAAATEPTIKSEPVEDVDLLSTVSQAQYEDELDKYMNFTHEDLAIASPTTTVSLSSSPIDKSDASAPLLHSDQRPAGYSYFDEDLEYPGTSTSPTIAVSSSSRSLPTDAVPLLELAQYFYFTDQPDYPITASATADSNSFSGADTSPTTSSPSSFTSFSAPTASQPTPIVSPNSLFATISSSSSSELSSSGAPDINTEGVPCSSVALDEASDSVKPSAEPEVHYTFVDPHEKHKKRRTKGVKNSTPIACTFCRRRKIRCGGSQEGGVCKSCIRLNHEGECLFPAVSYRGQRLGGSNSSSKRKPTQKSKGSGKRVSPSSEST